MASSASRPWRIRSSLCAAQSAHLPLLLFRSSPPASFPPSLVWPLQIAGLVAGASKGAGMGNQFLSHVRGVQLAVLVVRAFEDRSVTHVSDHVDPVADAEVIELELALADLAQVERRMARRRLDPLEAEALSLLRKHLDAGKPARTVELNAVQRESVAHLDLLTAKPVLYAVNVAEEDLAAAQSGASGGSEVARAFFAHAKVRKWSGPLVVCTSSG